MLTEALAVLEDAASAIPDGPCLSRCRLYLDAAHMVLRRCWNMVPREAWVRYLAWDSSPQFGRDFELALIRSVRVRDLRFLLWACHRMKEMWQTKPWENETTYAACKEEERELMMKCKSKIDTHALPSTQIGFGASSFAKKFQSLCHGARLEHWTNRSLDIFMREFVTHMEDYGTESRVSKLKPTPLSTLCPHFLDSPDNVIKAMMEVTADGLDPQPAEAERTAQHADPDDTVFEDPGQLPPAEASAHDDAEVFEAVGLEAVQDSSTGDLTGSFETPPMHHINDTAMKGMHNVMPHWNDNTFKSQQVCKIIRKRAYQPKLLERCFSSPELGMFQPILKRFKGWIHIERWGTVSFSTPELKRIERIMRLGWDKVKFQQGWYNNLGQDKEDTVKIVNDVDAAVEDPFYWAYLCTQDAICKFMVKATVFVESCPCHYWLLALAPEDLPADVLKDMQRQWSWCPFRGDMVAELATDFFEMLGGLCRVSSGELLATLPGDISPEQRACCLREFESGRAHICLTYTLKLAHLSEAPHCYFAIANLNRTVAIRAAELLINSDSAHLRAFQLRGHPMFELYQRWKSGESLFHIELLPLCEYVCTARLAGSNDRPGEGQHAKVASQGRAAPCHTEQYHSFYLRCPEVQEMITKRPAVLHELSECLHMCSNPARCSEMLGLSEHPSVEKVRRQDLLRSRTNLFREVVHAKVIYHADPFTMYSKAPAALEYYPFSGGERLPHNPQGEGTNLDELGVNDHPDFGGGPARPGHVWETPWGDIVPFLLLHWS
jgi:hypothetical protein